MSFFGTTEVNVKDLLVSKDGNFAVAKEPLTEAIFQKSFFYNFNAFHRTGLRLTFSIEFQGTHDVFYEDFVFYLSPNSPCCQARCRLDNTHPVVCAECFSPLHKDIFAPFSVWRWTDGKVADHVPVASVWSLWASTLNFSPLEAALTVYDVDRALVPVAKELISTLPLLKKSKAFRRGLPEVQL